MVADTGLGWACPVAINLTDANGSPLAGAVASGGALSLYGPGSAATPVHTGTVSDLGNGDYGLTVPGSALGTAGYYAWTIPTITVGAYTFVDQAGGFSVGAIPPEYRTLRAIVQAVCEALGVGLAGRTTASGSTTTLVDSRWVDAGLATNELVGAELLILEPGATTDTNPLRVTASNHTTGTLTFTPAATAVASGTDYLLIRQTQRGLRYAQIVEAIVAAVAHLATRQEVTDAVTLTTTRGAYEYPYPDSWLAVTDVAVARRPTAYDPYWEPVMPSLWEVWPDRRVLRLPVDFGGEYLVRLSGRAGVPEPRALAGLVKVPWTRVRDEAVGQLSVPPAQRAGLAYRRASAAALRGVVR